VPLDLDGVITGVWSDGSSNTDSVSGSLLVGKSVVSLLPGSDGLGSSVEGEPLFPVSWVVVSDSESVLV